MPQNEFWRSAASEEHCRKQLQCPQKEITNDDTIDEASGGEKNGSEQETEDMVGENMPFGCLTPQAIGQRFWAEAVQVRWPILYFYGK